MSLWLAIGCSLAILISIAVSQILLALSLGILLLSGLPLKWPRIAIPLGVFLAWIFVALAFSADPRHGLPMIRKMLVFAMLPITFSAFRTVREGKWLMLAWVAIGTFTAGKGVQQYIADIAGAKAAHIDFYHFYISDRITGFMSHWMTFSGEELFVLLIAGAFVLFAPVSRWWLLLVTGCLSIVGLALVFSDTRSIWIASLVAGAWLLWSWDKRSVLAIPVLLLVGMVVVPGAVKQRAMSIVHPEKETDSNEHRIIVWRTGWEMIKAHPLVGVGPEQITKPAVFFQYMPRDIHLPLPSGYYGHLHNIYIHYAAECGLPAALALTAALFLALYDFMRAITLLPPGRSDRRFMLQTGVACVIGAMVSGVFEKNLGDTEVLTMFLVITSLAYLAAAGDSGPANKAPSPTLI